MGPTYLWSGYSELLVGAKIGRILGNSGYGTAARIAHDAGSAWDGSVLLDMREERT